MTRLLPALLLLAACSDKPVLVQNPPEPPLAEETDPPVFGDILVEPATMDFGTVAIGCDSEPENVLVTNVGEAALTIYQIRFEGPDKVAYTKQTNPQVLAPNESIEIEITFGPNQSRDYSDVEIVIESSDPDTPEAITDILGVGGEYTYRTENWTQAEAAAIDVLWVIDNSGSMSSVVGDLSDAFLSFISVFVGLDLDYHIGVVTTDMDDSTHSGKFRGPVITTSTPDPVAEFTSQANQGFSGSATEKGLDAAYAALTTQIGATYNQDFLRPDANLAIVVVSDENDYSGMGPVEFSNWLEASKADPSMVSLSGLTGPRNNNFFACAERALRYHNAIGRTGGVWGNICQNDIGGFLDYLANAVAGELTSFSLTSPPADLSEVVVEVDGVEIAQSNTDGWSYDPSNDSISLNGDFDLEPGSTIDITYPTEPDCEQ